jgi:hypothetical protein
MATFFERLGHRVIRTRTACWYDFYRGFYVSFPHARLVDPGSWELATVFRRVAAGVRYFAPADSRGRQSYALMCRGRDYDLARLSSNTRSKVRRGLSRCTVERLEPKFVRQHGRKIHEDTLQRIRVREPYAWDPYWAAVEASDAAEVWGALVDGELAAYLVGVRGDRYFEIFVARSANEALRHYPNNALLYTVVRDMLGREAIDAVWFGAESLEGQTGVDDFKLSMGFQREPIRQRIVLHPVLRPALKSSLVVRSLAAMAARRPDNEFWRKLRGLVEFSAPVAATR